MIIEEKRMQQLHGMYADLNTEQLLVGEIAIPSDHRPVYKKNDNAIGELLTLEDAETLDEALETTERLNREIQQLAIDKVGINDEIPSSVQTYSSQKIEELASSLIDDENTSTRSTYSSEKIAELLSQVKPSTTLYHEEYEALPDEEKDSDNVYFIRDTGEIIQARVNYGGDKAITIDKDTFEAMQQAGTLVEGAKYRVTGYTDKTIIDAEQVSYYDGNVKSGLDELNGKIENIYDLSSEKIIGKWGNKNVYRKALIVQIGNAVNTTYISTTTIEDVDAVLKIEGALNTSNGYHYQINSATANYMYTYINKNGFAVCITNNSSYLNCTAIVFVEYTKSNN